MTTHAQFYLTRAAVARELADGCKLDNVKESHLRAAEAWDGFAARAMKADSMRAEEVKRKSAEPGVMQQESAMLESESPALNGDAMDVQETSSLSVF